MEETNILNGGVKEIQEILSNLNEREEEIRNYKTMASEEKRLSKALQQEMNLLEDDKKQRVKLELNQYIAEEEQIISNNKKKINEATKSRSKAKSRGVKSRIEDETEDLVKANKELHREIRKGLTENNLPAYCDSKWFYTLFYTQGTVQWLIKILVFFVGLFIIPWIVTAIFTPKWKIKFFVIVVKIIVWVITMIIMSLIYVTIYLYTKDKDNGTIEKLREKRDDILDNEKKIKRIKKNIKTDTDESQYNLGNFDEELAALNDNLTQVTKERDEKIKDFEENKKQAILEEIEEAHKESIEKAKEAIEAKTEELGNQNQKITDLNNFINEKYGAYIPEKYLSESGCQKMTDVIMSGQATTIEGALKILMS